MPAMDYIAGNLIFIGLMGAGKTTIGKCLAQRLGWQFYDSDQEIVKRSGVPISTIFELEGEASFREREHAVIQDLSAMKRCVIATGGGAILQAANRELLQASGTVIYLSTSIDCILKRTSQDKSRPLLQVENPREQLEKLFQLRDPLYHEIADVIIETHTQPISAVVSQLIQQLKLYEATDSDC
ncbi:shikimate kinase AroK [Vitreoscilla stercoraria]|uniref:Shikimate kinase n=2 Tax=Neisseriaceae TaxID=481 RepID=A0ABY4EB37_VITST|nr:MULTISPECIES: shikimate kinase AroK [Vitreoscilla]AUZ05623.1 shikimate kinase [Vitreoscilla sp. C1]UOO92963.1 shikimate kinase AroK [Vitreoscilla stercoraria]